MLAILISGFWLHSLIDQFLTHKICVSYSTELILGTFGIEPVIKSETLC